MANEMPARICKGDKVRLIDRDTAKKYALVATGLDEYTALTVDMVDKVSGRPRLYVTHNGAALMLWANDCKLAWGRASKERREALGL